MVTFRNNKNNYKKPSFRSNNNRRPSFRRNEERSNFSNNDNFQRNGLGRNNHNVSKLIEKYNNLAREALANEDKTLSENYFQYADHFTRVQNEQEKNKMNGSGHVNASLGSTKARLKTLMARTCGQREKTEKSKNAKNILRRV